MKKFHFNAPKIAKLEMRNFQVIINKWIYLNILYWNIHSNYLNK